MLEKQFVTYEIALKLKELGFDKRFKLFENTVYFIDGKFSCCNDSFIEIFSEKDYVIAPLWQQATDWCDSKGLFINTIVVDTQYKSIINKIDYETELFPSRNESIKRAIEFAISYLQNNQ